MAQTPQVLSPFLTQVHRILLIKNNKVTLYSDMYYQGDSVNIPADGECHELPDYQPNLALQVSSIQIPSGVQCSLSNIGCFDGVIDVPGVIVDAPGTNSLYNFDFNDATLPEDSDGRQVYVATLFDTLSLFGRFELLSDSFDDVCRSGEILA
ncbi:hypothetical protein AbraIFM66951_009110 [Aspergillus brasiliensis]|uniref:Uncharacterized protein n=1 Tax=Aspergillus brasiliensis TaxID=319629 RepID=A0A9W5YXE9_9EURO|nr:hypothetical protein AbraCBS73388_010559 [Aspergillus brasiliensis]GKZ46203.1 hypothetical protein AbraIFM66951_009110 [Aspergillus brasiliensis]